MKTNASNRKIISAIIAIVVAVVCCAVFAVSAKAELLIILSDVEGLYSADPHKDPEAKLIEAVHGVTDEILALGGGEGSSLGTGGMRTKLRAAQICNADGCDLVIANGEDPEILYSILEDRQRGYTRFYAN